MKLRLLTIVPSLEIGGAEKQVAVILKGLDKERYDRTLVCCSLRGPLVREIPDEVKRIDLEKRSRWDFPRLVWRLRKLIHELRPDIVLTSTEYAALLAWCSVAMLRERPLLVCRRDSIRSHSRWAERGRGIKRRIDRFVENRADCIIAPSKGLVAPLEVGRRGRAMVVVIPNAVDVSSHREASCTESSPESSAKPLFVAMGRLVDMKGFDILIEAVVRLPRGTARLRIIGDGPMRSELELLARHRGVSEEVEFVGLQENPQGFLSEAWAGVVPSAFESFGNVIVEMFAAGLPVIAFDVDHGPREIIRSGQNGLLVEHRTVGALAEAMSHVLSDATARKEMGRQAREDARKFYDTRVVVGAYEQCFARLTSGVRQVEERLEC